MSLHSQHNLVRFVDLPAAFAEVHDGLEELWAGIIKDCCFVGGPLLDRFEDGWASYCKASWAVGVASGTEALRLALLVSGVGPGDEVVTLANTFFATASAISAVGAHPIFVDPAPGDLLMTASSVEAVITSRTKAILPVHLYGQSCDITELQSLAALHDLVIIEDACQAHGAVRHRKVVGSSGNLVCFSFYPGKNLGGIGEAGAIVGANSELKERLRCFRSHGQRQKNVHVELGQNSHLDALNAGVLSLRLPLLNAWNERRRHWAALYDEAFDRIGVCHLAINSSVKSAYHLYPIGVSEPEEFRRQLLAMGIETGCHYPQPVPMQPVYKSSGYDAADFPVATSYATSHVTLPMHPHLDEKQVARVIDAVQDIFRKHPDWKKLKGKSWGTHYAPK